MNFSKKVRGSALVEKIMIVVFSLVVGSVVISFLIGQIKKAQNVEVDVGLINENLEDNVDNDPDGFQELTGSQFRYHYFTDPDVNNNRQFLNGWVYHVNSDAEMRGYMYIFMDDPDSLNLYNAFVEFAKDPSVDLSDGEFSIFVVEVNISEYRKDIRRMNSGIISSFYFVSGYLKNPLQVYADDEGAITKQTFLDAYDEELIGFPILEQFPPNLFTDYEAQDLYWEAYLYRDIRDWSRDKRGYMFIFMDDPDSLNFYNAFVEFVKDPNVDLSDGVFFIYVVQEKFSEYREEIREVNEGYLAEIHFLNSEGSTNIEIGSEYDSTITKQTFLDAYNAVFG